MSRKTFHLILILGSLLLFFCFFENFELPDPNTLKQKRFISSATDPLQRLGDYVEYKMDDATKENLENMERRLHIEWGSGNENVSTAPTVNQESENKSEQAKKNQIRYSLLNVNTIRVQDDTNQINCRIESHGVNLSWQRRMTASSSYVIEHNTAENRSSANFQWGW